MGKALIITFIAIFSSVNQVWAQDDNILDFEGDVITGESRKPDLFLQLAKDNPDMDSLIFLRKNFNDFHEMDRKRRPLFQMKRKRKK